MTKKLQVKVNGKPFYVEVGDFFGGSAEVTVNGKAFSIEVEEEGGAPVVQQPVRTAPTAAPVKSTPVAAPAVAIATGSGSDVLSAPMPGVIMDIAVKPGDSVKTGDIICALEAMKMKNQLRSQRDGKVASVEVTEGQRVPFGAIIIRYA